MIQQNLNIPSETVTSTPAKRLARIVALVLIIVFLVAIGVIPRLHRQREALAAVNEAPATHPVVATTRPKQGEPTSELLLPGDRPTITPGPRGFGASRCLGLADESRTRASKGQCGTQQTHQGKRCPAGSGAGRLTASGRRCCPIKRRAFGRRRSSKSQYRSR